MKLINHKKNNIYDIDTYVMRGTIIMNEKEFTETWRALQTAYKRSLKECNTNIRDGLSRIASGAYPDTKKRFCLGITASSLIALKYNLKNYKRHNYGIKIK